ENNLDKEISYRTFYKALKEISKDQEASPFDTAETREPWDHAVTVSDVNKAVDVVKAYMILDEITRQRVKHLVLPMTTKSKQSNLPEILTRKRRRNICLDDNDGEKILKKTKFINEKILDIESLEGTTFRVISKNEETRMTRIPHCNPSFMGFRSEKGMLFVDKTIYIEKLEQETSSFKYPTNSRNKCLVLNFDLSFIDVSSAHSMKKNFNEHINTALQMFIQKYDEELGQPDMKELIFKQAAGCIDGTIDKLYVTGVTPAFRTGVSPLLILEDISERRQFSGICGFTQQEVQSIVACYLGNDTEAINDATDDIKRLYFGYNFVNTKFDVGIPSIYNIHLVFHYLRERRSGNHVFKTFEPTAVNSTKILACIADLSPVSIDDLLTLLAVMSLKTASEAVMQATLEVLLPSSFRICEFRLVMNGMRQYGDGRFGYVDIFVLENGAESTSNVVLELKYLTIAGLLSGERGHWIKNPDASSLKTLDEVIGRESEEKLLQRKYMYWSREHNSPVSKELTGILDDGYQQLEKYIEIIGRGRPENYTDSGVLDSRVVVKSGSSQLRGKKSKKI
ncbi:4086_t:CDS:2, partial [Acaulospora colombiana]